MRTTLHCPDPQDPHIFDYTCSMNVFIGELSVDIVSQWTPAQRAQAVGLETFVDLDAAIADHEAQCTQAVLAAHKRAVDALSTPARYQTIGALLDAVDNAYKALPAAVQQAYDECLQDIDRAGMTAAERDVVQANREARGLK